MNSNTLKTVIICLILFFMNILSGNSFAQENIIKIWPGLAPGTENRQDNEKVNGGGIIDIFQPDLRIFMPADKTVKMPAVLVFPGGGYRQVVMQKEGYKIAEWLNENGIAAFVLKYRLNPDEALQDAQRALSLVRSKSAEYEIDPDKIGVIGFSAGGHLAANLSINSDKRNLNDAVDSVNCKPNFMIQVYGAIGQFVDKVDENTPPTFLVHAADDSKVPVMMSVEFFAVLKKHNVPAELHIYEKGEHGFALREVDKPVHNWAKACIDWLGVRGILTTK